MSSSDTPRLIIRSFDLRCPMRLRWQKLLAWLAAFEGAINYDPQADIDATITQLRKVVARLETRMTEMEGRHQRILPLVVTDVVDSPQPGWMP